MSQGSSRNKRQGNSGDTLRSPHYAQCEALLPQKPLIKIQRARAPEEAITNGAHHALGGDEMPYLLREGRKNGADQCDGQPGWGTVSLQMRIPGQQGESHR